ncbi:hypothetical protein B0H13DRAFT_1664697 [Mycena leptocephala]|nr:hypothetical protein B0H13DRAFT_1664697 [Mycena leptocephala]
MLEKLQPVTQSQYDDDKSGGCMDGTRVGVLARLLAWATDPQSPSVYWLSGMAGTGKTAIARSFAKLLDSEQRNLLGASFFCSRASEARSSVERIIPTVAYQLAWPMQLYRAALINTLTDAGGKSFTTRTPAQQFTQLVVQPSEDLPMLEAPVIVIIDALDECSDMDTVRNLLTVFLRASDQRLKFFITSRPEPDIHAAFRQDISRSIHLRLHDIEDDIVAADIKKYLITKLAGVSQHLHAQGWPSDNHVDSLVQRTGKLFIFAFTAVQYMSQKGLSQHDIKLRLQKILSPPQDGISRTGIIDNLYGQIFEVAYSGKEPNEVCTMRQPVDTVICLREPLSINGISNLLGFPAGDVREVLGPFHSVINIPASNDEAPRLFHASFPDFMTEAHRSGKYRLDIETQHAILALQCICLMNSTLNRNPLGLIRTTMAPRIDQKLVDKNIPAGLQYASVYWATHLGLATHVKSIWNELVSGLGIFVKSHLLHWLECLSLMGKLHLAVDCLHRGKLFAAVRTNVISVSLLFTEFDHSRMHQKSNLT